MRAEASAARACGNHSPSRVRSPDSTLGLTERPGTGNRSIACTIGCMEVVSMEGSSAGLAALVDTGGEETEVEAGRTTFDELRWRTDSLHAREAEGVTHAWSRNARLLYPIAVRYYVCMRSLW